MPDTNKAVFSNLAIMILIEDFNQFSLVVGKPLWEKAIIIDDLHGKAI